MTTDGLRPPKEYEHLRWHFLRIGNYHVVRRWLPDGVWLDDETIPHARADGWVYVAPAVPLAVDDATMERMCDAWYADLSVMPWDQVPEGVKNTVRAGMRAVLAELMKGPNDEND